IDGAGRLTVLWRGILPLTRSALATLAPIYSLWIWNDFLFPLVYLRSSSHFTVPPRLGPFHGMFTTFLGYLIRAPLIAIWPPLLVYLALSRQIQARLAFGGLKG